MIHLILQGKGGCGKSYIASVLSQYVIEKEGRENVTLFDIDHINSSLANISSLEVKVFKVTDEDNMLDTKRFDELIEHICGFPTTQHFVIDTGAATFDELSQYMYENGAYEVLSEIHKIVVHTPIVGGAAVNDTLVSFAMTVVTRTTDDVMLVPWLNNFLSGNVEDKIQEMGKGDRFEDTAPYKNNAKRILGVVRLEQQKKLFTADLHYMTSNHFTFDDAIHEASVMVKSRLKKLKTAVFTQLDELNWEKWDEYK